MVSCVDGRGRKQECGVAPGTAWLTPEADLLTGGEDPWTAAERGHDQRVAARNSVRAHTTTGTLDITIISVTSSQTTFHTTTTSATSSQTAFSHTSSDTCCQPATTSQCQHLTNPGGDQHLPQQCPNLHQNHLHHTFQRWLRQVRPTIMESHP